jgi:hypothetical protein
MDSSINNILKLLYPDTNTNTNNSNNLNNSNNSNNSNAANSLNFSGDLLKLFYPENNTNSNVNINTQTQVISNNLQVEQPVDFFNTNILTNMVKIFNTNDSNIKSNDFDSLDLYDYESMIKIYSNPFQINKFGKYLESKYITNPAYINKLVKSGNKNLIEHQYKLYFKLTKPNYTSRGYKYNQGLNIDPQDFNPEGWCSGGGFYFSKIEDLHQFTCFGSYLTPILVPANTPVYHEVWSGHDSESKTSSYNKYKAPMVYTLPRINIDSPYARQLLEPYKIFEYHKFKYAIAYNLSKITTNHITLYYDNKPIYSYDNKYRPEIFKTFIEIISNTGYKHSLAYNYCYGNYLRYLVKNKNKKIMNWFINDYFPHLIANCKFVNERLKQQIGITNIGLYAQPYLERFEIDLIKLFSKYRAVTAGSHPVQYIFRLKYTPNDIDIYISSHYKNQFIKEVNEFNDGIKITMQKQTKDFGFAQKYNMTGVDSVYTLVTFYFKTAIKATECQVIFVNDEIPYNFIKDNFDFDICTSSFDFANKKFLINYKKANGFDNMRIQDSYIEKMTGSKTDSYSTYRANKTIERMCKYIQRGFYIENWKEFLIEIRDKMCKD